MSGHRWSGWPGAWCLDCGIEDYKEIAIGRGAYDPYSDRWEDTEEAKKIKQFLIDNADCKEPGSNKHNPYEKKE